MKVKSAAALLVSVMLAGGWSAAVQAQCGYPNSERGAAPGWLCDTARYEGDKASYLAVGDKSRMPSISLQSRLAGKQAMVAVVEKLLRAAQADLQARVPADVALNLPNAQDWKRVARFKGIKVLAKTVSPVRHLYVLAGVPEEKLSQLQRQARRELLAENKHQLRKALGEAQWRQLQDWARAP